MKILLSYFSVLALLLVSGHCHDVSRMVKTLHALTRALHYTQGKVSEINLDAVYGVRKIQEQLKSYLKHDAVEFRTVRHWLKVLHDKAKRVADQGRRYVYENDFQYSAVLGSLMDERPKYVWHSSRNTSERFLETRIQCSSPLDNLNETREDLCFSQIKADESNSCNISPACMELNSEPHQRDYVLTHQLLFWRFIETSDCSTKMPDQLQLRLCSNVMRDAELIAAADYPESHRDLFMEQIGLCGFWGFSDFNKPDWTNKVLDWQQDSGCFAGYEYYYCTDNLQPDPPIRIKRRDKMLSDLCSSHKTAVGMLALVMNLRFEAEKAFQEMDKSQNRLNKLLT